MSEPNSPAAAMPRMVRSPWARHRICLLADALLRQGTLKDEQIFELLYVADEEARDLCMVGLDERNLI